MSAGGLENATSLPAIRRRTAAVMESVMKRKISFIGLVLGAVLGIVAGLLAGGWLLWLGMGLVVGLLIGSAGARRSRLPRNNMTAGNLNL
jgi:hypothetical protein